MVIYTKGSLALSIVGGAHSVKAISSVAAARETISLVIIRWTHSRIPGTVLCYVTVSQRCPALSAVR